MNLSRRAYLCVGAVLLSVTLTGCTGEIIPGVCGSMNEVEIRAEPVSLSETERESAQTVVFANLSEPEKEIMRTAIEDGSYAGCATDGPGGAERLRERVLELQEKADGFVPIYLKRNSTYYSLYFKYQDYVISSPE